MTTSRFTPLVADEILDSLFAERPDAARPINMTTASSSFDVRPLVQFDPAELLEGAKGYADPHGSLVLRRELSGYYQRRYGVDLAPSRFFITDGGLGALTLAFARLLGPGDEAIVPGIAFPAYVTLAQVFHARVVPCPLDEDGAYDRDALESLINSNTKLILTNSPSNPLGTVSARTELEYLCSTGIPVISDEVYEAFAFGSEYVSACEVSDETFLVGSFSKAFALAGLRLGYLILPASEDPNEIWNIKASVNFCTGVVTQRIGLAIMRNVDACLQAHRQYLESNRELLFELCKKYGFQLLFPNPSGFFALIDSSQIDRPAAQIARDLVSDYRLGIMPASDFGPSAEGFIRVNFAADPENLTEALQRIHDYMTSCR